jgi:trans-AT polyketide synthase, acyltransferase and oxidoreductase domains
MGTVYLFPGQGAQRKGMGADLFGEYRDLVAEADATLGYSIEELCLADQGRLGQTEFTQPALYVVNALSYLKRIRTAGAPPALLAGHSLGEYNALFAAGAFDFVTGLKLVVRRGQLMSGARGGGMAAVIGPTAAQIRKVLETHQLASIDIANLNAPTQTVISGPSEDIRRAEASFLKEGASMYVVLNVSGAFHSRYMAPVKAEFARYLNGCSLKPLRIPVMSNWSARPYSDAAVRDNLLNQITGAVRWVETIEYLSPLNTMFEEVGPGTTLTNLLRQFDIPAARHPDAAAATSRVASHAGRQ